MKIPIGVANSVSYNLDYHPIDTLNFVLQSGFDLIQIYLNQSQMEMTEMLGGLKTQIQLHSSLPLFIHAEGDFNQAFFKGEYKTQLFNYLLQYESSRVIFHYDENEKLENILELLEEVENENFKIYLENFFLSEGVNNAEKNLRKYLAIFSLANNVNKRIFPVVDIPRFFHSRVGFAPDSALNWCYQILNFFSNKKMPILLHLIDSRQPAQNKSDYCPIGEGIIPYSDIFGFIDKNGVPIEGIILEYLDKVNPLKSRENLYRMLQ